MPHMGQVLPWTEGRGRLDGIVTMLRAARAGLNVAWQSEGLNFGESSAISALLHDLGLATVKLADSQSEQLPIVPPRIVLLAGSSSGYPYAAYYAHCLWSLGLSFVATDARGLAAGALREADLLVIPGGFSTWGLDRAEDAPGADAEVRWFLDVGGAVIGSCGGAFYLSSGRLGWQGSTGVKPTFTHEYLLTGAALLNVHLEDQRLATGLTPDVEIPYYHGPVWPAAGHNAPALATFSGLACPSRLFIDNPLQADRFEREMSGRPAVLAPEGAHRAVLFSPHPEMGDLLRKWIALDGYVRKYLPIRGPKVMQETLRFYCPDDSQAFRLVLNAMERLGTFSYTRRNTEHSRTADHALARRAIDRLRSVIDAEFRKLIAEAAAQRDEPWSQLVVAEAERVRGEAQTVFARLDRALDGLGPEADPQTVGELIRLSGEAHQAVRRPAGAPIIERMSFLELPVRLASAAARLLEADAAVRAALAEASAA